MSKDDQVKRMLANTVLPLLPWTLQIVFGSVFRWSEWQAVALSYVPPPLTLCKVILEEVGDLASPALLSPSGRRRLRNRYKRLLRQQLQHNPIAHAARDWLMQQRLGFEASGCRPDPKRIRKLGEIEAETLAEFVAMAQNPGEVRQTFSPHELGLGHREIKNLESTLGISVSRERGQGDTDEYVQALLPHLIQLTFHPDAVNSGGLRKSSLVWKWTGLQNWPPTLNGVFDLFLEFIERLQNWKHMRQMLAYVITRKMRQEYGLDKGRNTVTFSAIKQYRAKVAARRQGDAETETWEPEDIYATHGYADTDARMTWEAIRCGPSGSTRGYGTLSQG